MDPDIISDIKILIQVVLDQAWDDVEAMEAAERLEKVIKKEEEK